MKSKIDMVIFSVTAACGFIMAAFDEHLSGARPRVTEKGSGYIIPHNIHGTDVFISTLDWWVFNVLRTLLIFGVLSVFISTFIRLFDNGFGLDHVRRMQLTLTVEGEDGYVLKGSSNMAKISRDPADLVGQMLNAHHQYPDGAVLFLGTLFAPIEDRDAKGQGFTHKMGDIVTVEAPELGALTNRMTATDKAAPWTFGASHLMRNLAKRGLL